MRYHRFWLLLSFLGAGLLASIAPARQQANFKTDQDALQGDWVLVYEESNGELDPHVAGIRIVGNNLNVIGAKGERQEAKMELDPETSPKSITLISAENPARRILGIYSIAKDTLKLCSGRVRPKEFTTAPADGNTFLIFERKSSFERRKKQGDPGIKQGKAGGDAPAKGPIPPEAEPRREYVITSRLMEAGADKPKVVFHLPNAIIFEGQLQPLHIDESPDNLLESAILKEKIKIGTFLDVKVKRLGKTKARLNISLQRNELEQASVNEIRVVGNSLQAIQEVEFQKPLKLVLQKDATGSAQRWLEITVVEQIISSRDSESTKYTVVRNDNLITGKVIFDSDGATDNNAQPEAQAGTDAKVRELLKELFATLKESVNLKEQEHRDGRGTMEEVIQAKKLLLKAELELCDTDKERVDVYERAYVLANDNEKMMAHRFKQGLATHASVLTARANRLEAEISLHRAKATATQSKDKKDKDN